MKDILRAFAVLALLVLPATAEEPPIPAEPSPAALAFVSKFSDAHLTAMLSRIGARQPTMVALSQLHGQMLAAAFDTEIVRTVELRGKEWRANMARAWTGLLSDEELDSLARDGAASPHSEKYQSVSGTAGQRMQTLSQELFRQLLAETIRNTVKVLGEPVPDGTTGPDAGKTE